MLNPSLQTNALVDEKYIQSRNSLEGLHSNFFARYLTRLFSSVIRQIGRIISKLTYKSKTLFQRSEDSRTYHRSSVTKTHPNFSRKYSCITNEFSFAKA